MTTTDEQIEAEVKRRLAVRDKERQLSQANSHIKAAIQNLFSARDLYRLHKLPGIVAVLEGAANGLIGLSRSVPQ
jgi:hypothetical protein